MPSHFYIKQNDTRPAITANLTDANDAAVNLTGSSVKFNMRVEPAGTTKISLGAAIIENAEAGQVSYSWTSSNTDTADDYEGEFQVTFAGGSVQTFPGRNYIAVHVIDDVA
tara:strand:- start:561 stop:893 length:333 start_codon:yes stop_codon:yes gene_type:complete